MFRATVVDGVITVGVLRYESAQLARLNGQTVGVGGSMYARVAIPDDGAPIALMLDPASLRAHVAKHAAQWERELALRRRPPKHRTEEIAR
jgi:hypothetical protein